LGLERLGVVLFVGLLLVGGGPLIQSVGGQVGAVSTAAATSPPVEPLASTSTATSASTQSLPPSLAGVNGTIWEDDSGGTCAECTYTVYLTAGGVSTPNSYFLAIWYLTDPACPPAVEQELVHLDIGANGTTLNDNAGGNFIELCTRASNPIVQDCGQDQLWYVANFTLTVTQTSISGEYQSQYWTWDTAADGTITNCMLENNFTQPFTLTPVFNSTSVSSSATTSQQNPATTNSSPVQTSGSSTTSASSTTTSTTTSTRSGGSGHLGVEILAAASAAVVVLAAASWLILRKRPHAA
jgi:hypothetical protein